MNATADLKIAEAGCTNLRLGGDVLAYYFFKNLIKELKICAFCSSCKCGCFSSSPQGEATFKGLLYRYIRVGA